MNRILNVLISGFLFVVIVSHYSYAEPGAPVNNTGRGFQDERMSMMPPMRHHGMDRMDGMPEAEPPMWMDLKGLGLDEKQKATIKEIKSGITKELIKRRADMHVAGIELKDLLDKEPVDLKAVEVKLKQIEALKTEMHLSLIKVLEEVKSKLTPEQKKKWQEKREMEPNMGPPMIGGMPRNGVRMAPLCEK